MFSRNSISAVIGGLALGAGIAVTVNSSGQEEPRAVLVPQQGTPPPAAASSGMKALAAERQELHVTALSADTFVTVKDHGDSQTVSVFKVDPRGQVHLGQKARFFY